MGYHIHKAIVVTGYDAEVVRRAHEVAREVFNECAAHVGEPTPPAINGFTSFLIAPDGSKLGWDDARAADECRDEWKSRAADLAAGGAHFDWVEVAFGGDEPDINTCVRAHG